MLITIPQDNLSVSVELSWLSSEQGGRKRAIRTADYAATAYFNDGNMQQFSIILHFPAKVEGDVKVPARTDCAKMSFLAPEVVSSRIKKGIDFFVTEGARVVAKGTVLKVLRRITKPYSYRHNSSSSSHSELIQTFTEKVTSVSQTKTEKVEIQLSENPTNGKTKQRIYPSGRGKSRK